MMSAAGFSAAAVKPTPRAEARANVAAPTVMNVFICFS